MIAGMLAGLVVGFTAPLIPGLHLALLLSLLLVAGLPAWIGYGPAALFIAAAAGSGIYTHRLAAVYHPSAGAGHIASLDPALRLTVQGRGPEALRLMLLGTDRGLAVALGVTLAMAHVLAQFPEFGRDLMVVTSGLALPVIGIWLAGTILRTRRKFATAVGFVLVSAFGYVALHHPAMKGDEFALAPIMGGLFGIPMMLFTLVERGGTLCAQQPVGSRRAIDQWLVWAGAVCGTFTAFLAGIGAGSLVSLGGQATQDTDEYLAVVVASEAANDLLSLSLILMAGAGRSADAVLLGRVAGTCTPTQALLLVGVALVAALLGRWWALAFEPAYIRVVRFVPQKLLAALVIALALVQVGLARVPGIAWPLTGAGVCLSIWCRLQQLPLQVSFAALALPLVAGNLGVAPAINGYVFGN